MSDQFFAEEDLRQMFEPFQERLETQRPMTALVESGELESGDILIFSGESLFSTTIRAFQDPCPFTHVAVVVRNPENREHYIFQSNNSKRPADISSQFITFKSDNRPVFHDGVKLSYFLEALGDYHGYAIVVRRLQWVGREDPEKRLLHRQWFWENFLLFMSLHYQKPYERHV